MKKHRKRWSTTEKLAIVNHFKTWGATKTSREFGVSPGSIYNWNEAYEEHGEAGLSGKHKKPSESDELRAVKRENDELKKLVAEKELRLRIQEEMLKKSR
ncbi:MAG: transposase [Winogradskyella sp.]|uniref:transposase n=1 Tax=Winogradskyella sp. TaxID=1883156 RepID=UPI0017DE2835|nr:transposase [Winogradskyella sp.]